MLHRAVIGRIHDAGNAGQYRSNDEGGRDHHVGLDAHQTRHTWVLSGGAHGPAQLGVVDQIHQHGQRDSCHGQNQNLRRCDDRTANLKRLGRQQCRIGLVVGLPDDHGQRLQQDGHAQGSDQRGQARAVAQRPVSDFFDGEIERSGHNAGNDGCQQQHQPAWCPGHGFLHQADAAPTGECPHHQHFAMGKVDQLDNAVHHRIAQSYQGVHAAENQTIDDLLQQNVHKKILRS